MADELLLAILLTSVPLILAATGELVAEKSGVLNLGVEGMMLMGAVAAFGVASLTGSPYLGILGGGLAGLLISLIFAVFVLGLATNQVATGLALTIFGTGLSGLIILMIGLALIRVGIQYAAGGVPAKAQGLPE
ncbi:MAG: ABC transporter permease, partial [SAR116 cluster bacterium]|nr:ABC transporter permease [SAR116 cluster bacterium]